jgi:hypothetical protein
MQHHILAYGHVGQSINMVAGDALVIIVMVVVVLVEVLVEVLLVVVVVCAR